MHRIFLSQSESSTMSDICSLCHSCTSQGLLKKYSREHKLLAETLLEYETLTGDEVRDLVLKGKKPNRPIVNTEGGSRGDYSILKADKGKKQPRGGLAGLADKVRGRGSANEGSQ